MHGQTLFLHRGIIAFSISALLSGTLILKVITPLREIRAVDKIRRGVGDQWVKPGDWELGDHMNEICCFDSKLEWVMVCSKFGCCSGEIF